jgi:hypothetical protein
MKEDETEQKNETKLEIKENENDKKGSPSETTLIVSDNKSKSQENNKNNSSTPLIEDNIYLNNKLKDDHYILIERTKFLNIPYFNFGFTTHFYFPTEKLPQKMKLSEIPNPPFTLGPNGKYDYSYNNLYF